MVVRNGQDHKRGVRETTEQGFHVGRIRRAGSQQVREIIGVTFVLQVSEFSPFWGDTLTHWWCCQANTEVQVH